MTYLDLITAAYRLRNVIDESEAPSAEQGVAAVDILNEMMAEWEADGVVLQYVPIPISQLDETLTIPEFAVAGVKAALAIRLSAGGSLSPELQAQAENGYRTIVRRAVGADLRAANLDHLPVGEGERSRGGDFFHWPP